VQETVASRIGAIGLFSTFKMVFSNFPERIPVSTEMLLTNRENHVVEEVAIFKKVLAFWKLTIRIRKILYAKVVRQIAVVGNFPEL
jgi:hypothetical protein